MSKRIQELYQQYEEYGKDLNHLSELIPIAQKYKINMTENLLELEKDLKSKMVVLQSEMEPLLKKCPHRDINGKTTLVYEGVDPGGTSEYQCKICNEILCYLYYESPK